LAKNFQQEFLGKSSYARLRAFGWSGNIQRTNFKAVQPRANQIVFGMLGIIQVAKKQRFSVENSALKRPYSARIALCWLCWN